MKRLSIILLFLLLLSSNIAFADNFDDVKIDKEDVLKCVNEIKSTREGKESLNDTTEIENIIPLSNENGENNGYIINLKTNNKQNAYFTIDVTEGSPILAEWGFGIDSSPIDTVDYSNQNIKGVIYAGPMNYLLVQEDEVVDLKTNKAMGDKFNGDNNKTEFRTLNFEDLIDGEKESLKTISLNSVPYEYNVKNVIADSNASGGLRYNFKPLSMGDFQHLVRQGRIKDENFCEVMAAFNMLRFYTHRRNISNLMMDNNDITMVALDESIGRVLVLNEHVIISGQTGKAANKGLHDYLNRYDKRKAKGGDFKALVNLWDFVKANLRSDNPVVVGCRGGFEGTRLYNFHAMLALGYGRTSSGVKYYRVANGWQNDISHFVNEGYVMDAWYLRW